MGQTAYGLPSRRLESAPKVIVIPHKGIDCVALHVNGKRMNYVCYHHADMVEALLQDGDERIEVTRWSIKREDAKGVQCCVRA